MEVPMFFSKDEIQTARKADLSGFVYSNYRDRFIVEGTSLKLAANPSVSIKKGFPGYYDFSTREHGNSIDFLVKHLDFSFVDAVSALVKFRPDVTVSASPQKRKFDPPEEAQVFKSAENYLLSRGINIRIISFLRSNHLIYQDYRQNIVFINRDRDFYEIRGTYSKKSFHQSQRLNPGGYWFFSLAEDPQMAYVCESSIDALSLLQLNLSKAQDIYAAYCSIAGVANQSAIQHIAKRYSLTILAVDNDPAGDACRDRNSGLKSIRPVLKDWNEDLLSMQKGCMKNEQLASDSY